MRKPRRTSLKSRDQIRTIFLSVHISVYQGYDFTFTLLGWVLQWIWWHSNWKEGMKGKTHRVSSQYSTEWAPCSWKTGNLDHSSLTFVACLKHDGFFTMWLLAAKRSIVILSKIQFATGVRPFIRMWLLTALSGSLPIKEKISATVETKVLTFTSQSVWSSAEHLLCFFWTFALQRCNLRTSCMPSWTVVDWSRVDGADSERLRSGEEGVWSWFNEVAANM